MAEQTSSIESLVKTGTAILAILFILGFLISNLHLMQFGIADFSSFNSRNVMIGAVFLLWVLLLCLPIIPLIVAISIIRTSGLTGWKPIALAVLLVPVSAIMIAFFSGIIVGFLNPWGRSWEDGFSLWGKGWSAQVEDVKLSARQFMANFGHLQTLVGAVAATMTAILATVRLTPTEEPEPEFLGPVEVKSWMAEVFYVLITLTLLTSSFAKNAYPNLLYNLGGGQPAIAKLVLEVPRADRAVLLTGLDLDGAGSDDLARTAPVVIWHQSDKFMHLRPLADDEASELRLISLELSAVKSVLYLDQTAQFGREGTVIEVQAN